MLYLIAYDLNAEGQNYKAVTQAIESLAANEDDCCRIQQSVWIVWSELQSAHAVLEKLKPAMDYNDHCFVSAVTHDSDHVLGNSEEKRIRQMKDHWGKIRFF